MLYRPHNVIFDKCGNLYIADQANRRLRKVTFNPLPPTPIPSVSISSNTSSDTVCTGLPTTYTATVTGGGTYLSYQWFVNGVSVAPGTGNSYTFTPVNGDSIYCVVTTVNSCSSPSVANSNIAHIAVSSIIPSISISANPAGLICLTDGSFVTFSSSSISGGSSPVYQWIINGSNVGVSAPGYTYLPVNADSVRCVLTSSESCASPSVVSSNMLIMTVDTIVTPAITLSGASAAAIGSTVTITATVANAGSSYLIYWMNHGIVFTTTTLPSVSYTKVLSADSITAKVIVTSGGCYDSTISFAQIVSSFNEGIINMNGASSIELYPNPAGDVLHILANITLQSVTITNLLGQVVYSSAGDNSMQATINIRQLSKGIYFVKINNERVVRFVKE